MMSFPRIGQRCRVHYRKAVAPFMPLHGKQGVIRVVCRRRPRNHCVEVDGQRYSVPAGNLVSVG